MLRTLSQLPGDAANTVDAADWKRMSDLLPADRNDTHIQELFYPGQVAATISATTRRRANFLIALDNRSYWDMYDYILKTPRLRFPDIHRLTRLSKVEGRVLHLLISNVVGLLNPEPTEIFDRRDNNKPPLRNDLIPALQHCSAQFVRLSEKRLDAFSWVDTDMGGGGGGAERSAPEMASILLQQELLDFAIARIAAFRSPATKAYLDQFPKQVSGTEYSERFFHQQTWGEVLQIVRHYVGDEFTHPTWAISKTDRSDGHGDGVIKPSERTATQFVESIYHFIKDIPEFVQDADFQNKLNSEALRAQLVVWFSQQQPRIQAADKHANELNTIGRDQEAEADVVVEAKAELVLVAMTISGDKIRQNNGRKSPGVVLTLSQDRQETTPQQPLPLLEAVSRPVSRPLSNPEPSSSTLPSLHRSPPPSLPRLPRRSPRRLSHPSSRRSL